MMALGRLAAATWAEPASEVTIRVEPKTKGFVGMLIVHGIE